jgi:hypothetical protein
MDVRLADGTVILDVPEGTPEDDIIANYAAQHLKGQMTVLPKPGDAQDAAEGSDRADQDAQQKAIPPQFLTPAPDAHALDDIDRAFLKDAGQMMQAQLQRGNTDEPFFRGFQDGKGGFYARTTFGSPGQANPTSVEDGAGGPWAVYSAHGHGPFANQSAYSLSNQQNFKPSPGDLKASFSDDNAKLIQAGRLKDGQELRQYLIMPDGGIRRYDAPVSDPARWLPVAPSGWYKWR